jgi:hypothetical protein
VLTVLIAVFLLECLLIFGWGLKKRERLIQYPFLAAAVFAGWVLPQIIGLSFYNNIPGAGLEKTVLMAILCLGALWCGYNLTAEPSHMLWWKLDRRRMVLGSVFLCVVGAYFAYRVSLLAATVTVETGGQWTGIITIYEFMSHVIGIAMVIALIAHLKRPSWQSLAVLVFCAAYYAERIFIGGRRAAMIQVAMMLLMSLWFQRRIMLPRWLVVVAFIAGALVVNSIGEYRGIMLGEDRTTWSGAGATDVAKIDFFGNFVDAMTGQRGNYEVTNAAMNIEAADRLGRYDFGLSLWNSLVDRFVPGQLIGTDIKQALKVDLDDPAYTLFRYVPQIGSTETGLTSAFLSFWYCGCIEFFLIGLFMGRWYRSAVGGNIAAQIVMMLMITPALESITHSAEEFVYTLVSLCVFLLPVFLYARIAMPSVPRAAPVLRAG